LQGKGTTPDTVTVTAETPVTAATADVSKVQARTVPVAVKAACDALSALVDATEYVKPAQLVEALTEVELLGVTQDARFAAAWLVGVLVALADTEQ
jgi:hypothetical protein